MVALAPSGELALADAERLEWHIRRRASRFIRHPAA
jgi:hypothetical protein